MADAVLKVVFAGPFVSIQDGGRHGLMRYGVPRSGPMDRLSFATANLALGNDADATGVEISVGGLTLDCIKGEIGFATTGGGFVTMRDGQMMPSWRTDTIRAGQRLVIRPGQWGSWAYLALAGRLITREWLGSAATHVLSGHGGGCLAAGQHLRIEAARPTPPRDLPMPVQARPLSQLHVVMGPQDHFFDAQARAKFLAGPWQLTGSYDRMGMRLAGPTILPGTKLDMPSEGIHRGAVQIAGDGVPVVLAADHQTTGGYPKIATVLDADLDGFVQGRPHDWVQFSSVTPAEAISIAHTRQRAVSRYLDGIRREATGQAGP